MGDHPGGQVGWLGTGRMGSVLIRLLLTAGLDVLIYNKTKASAVPLAAAGAKVVDQASDLAAPVLGNPRVAPADRLRFAVSGSPTVADGTRPYLGPLDAGANYVGSGVIARIVKLCQNLGLELVSENAEATDGLEPVGGTGKTTGDAAVSTA